MQGKAAAVIGLQHKLALNNIDHGNTHSSSGIKYLLEESQNNYHNSVQQE